MGELNTETGGIWQPALVRPQRPAAGRVVGGSGELAVADGTSRAGGCRRRGVCHKEKKRTSIFST
jgi:hypothetical protein